jgi:hypothetical protein
MEPTTPQFRIGPSGAFGPTSTNSSWDPRPSGPFGPDKMVQQPLPVNSSKGGASDSKYARGKGTTGAGSPIDLPPSGRPKPGMGGVMRGPISLGGGGGAFGKIK